MRKKILLFACTACLSVCASHLSASESHAWTGRRIVEEQKRRHDVPTEISGMGMALLDRSGHREVRYLRRHRRIDGGLEKSLIVFLEPSSVHGTALLSWENADRDDDQWVYLPAVGKTRRVAQGGKRSYFMGTDFTYEDLGIENIDDYRYTRAAGETVDGHACHVVEARPATGQHKRRSGYSLRRLWIREDIFFVVRIAFHDHRDRHVKTQKNEDLFAVEGDVWRARKSVMQNHARNHKTILNLKTWDLKQPIDESVFTERYITSGRHVE